MHVKHQDFVAMNPDLYTQMHTSAAWLRTRGIGGADLGIILGSGLGELSNVLSDRISIPYSEIPHMPRTGVVGHAGVLEYGTLGKRRVLMFRGRLHFYEGHQMWKVTYPMRLLQVLGVPDVLLTAAVGGVSQRVSAGDLVLITDHINLMGDNPLRGIDSAGLGDRFVEMRGGYHSAWRAEIRQAAERAGVQVGEGVYAAMGGPSLETPAECRFLNLIGADVVGMSVVPEVIVGVQAGIRMAALCVVTNINWPPEHVTCGDTQVILAMAGKKLAQIAQLLHALL